MISFQVSMYAHLLGLIRNSFGNYVVQKALKLAYGGYRSALIAAIQKNIPAIPDKKIRIKWEKICDEALPTDGSHRKVFASPK